MPWGSPLSSPLGFVLARALHWERRWESEEDGPVGRGGRGRALDHALLRLLLVNFELQALRSIVQNSGDASMKRNSAAGRMLDLARLVRQWTQMPFWHVVQNACSGFLENAHTAAGFKS